MDKYGFRYDSALFVYTGSRCDAWTAFFINLAYEGFLSIILIVTTLLLLFFIPLVCIPEVGLRCLEWKKQGRNCAGLSLFFEIRTQSIYCVCLTLVLLNCEMIYSLICHSPNGSRIQSVVPLSIFRVPALICYGLSYMTMLILWSNLYTKISTSNRDDALDLKHK